MTTGKKIVLGVGCAIPILCCAGGALLLQGTFGKAASMKNQQLAEARKEGIPVEPADLEAMLKASDADNAAPIYQKVLPDFEDRKPLSRTLNLIGKGMGTGAKPEDRQAADAALKQIAPQMALLEQAAQRPRCVWHRQWSKGVALLFPELAPMKGLTKAFCFRAQQQSERGDWQGALKSIATAQKIARHAGDDPTLIGMLVDIACESIAIRSLDETIAKYGKNPQFLPAAQNLLAGFGPLPNLRRTMGAEVVMGRIAIQQLKSTRDFTSPPDSDAGPSKVEQALFSSSMVKDAFDARYVQAYREMIQGIPEDPEKWEVASATMKNMEVKIAADNSPSNKLNQIMFPVFSQSAEALGQLLMRRRLTDTTLRLLQERAKTGQYPVRLPDYGKTRIDPFSGDPFHYGRVAQGFRLYSVGRDRSDDDGKPQQKGHADENHDEVIIFK